MFELKILTPEKACFNGQVRSIIAPGKAGYLEILTNHAPIVVLLKKGKITIKDADNKRHYYLISGGILEVRKNQAMLLTDTPPVPMNPEPEPEE